jgi:hypothetical protein
MNGKRDYLLELLKIMDIVRMKSYHFDMLSDPLCRP